MNQVEERKQQAEKLKLEVCRLLHWDELQYGEYQYRHGCEYLQHYIPCDPAAIDFLTRNKLFWNWWKNQWHDRDLSYLTSIAFHISNLDVDDLRAVYDTYHDVRILALEISPNAVILGNGYSKMISDIIKAEVA